MKLDKRFIYLFVRSIRAGDNRSCLACSLMKASRQGEGEDVVPTIRSFLSSDYPSSIIKVHSSKVNCPIQICLVKYLPLPCQVHYRFSWFLPLKRV